MLDLVAMPTELRQIGGDLRKARLLFAAKEAVYKAAYRFDQAFLEFPDIEVDLDARTAVTNNGRTVSLRACVSSRIVALALIRADQAQSRQDDQSTPIR